MNVIFVEPSFVATNCMDVPACKELDGQTIRGAGA